MAGGGGGGGRGIIAVLLGVAQDGGRPQPGCFKPCCMAAYTNPSLVRHPPSLGVVDTDGGLHIIDATRALAHQLHTLMHVAGGPFDVGRLKSVWLTHAHVGHVDGVGLLGKEAMDVKALPVHCSESVAELFHATPAWNQLLLDGRVRLALMSTQQEGGDTLITGVKVPHRAELSDTHAYVVSGMNKKLLYLPDHDSWRETLSAAGCDDSDVRGWLKKLKVDVALIDGTFFDANELPAGRQSTVPHPPVCETLKLLGTRQRGKTCKCQPAAKACVHTLHVVSLMHACMAHVQAGDPRVMFTHFNHTNPLLGGDGRAARRSVEEAGWEVGDEGMTFPL